MNDLFSTTPIDDDPAQWDALAASVAASAMRESRKRSGLTWLGETRGGWVAATLALAAALTWLAVPDRSIMTTLESGDLVAALGPREALGRELFTLDNPPALGTLLLGADER